MTIRYVTEYYRSQKGVVDQLVTTAEDSMQTSNFGVKVIQQLNEISSGVIVASIPSYEDLHPQDKKAIKKIVAHYSGADTATDILRGTRMPG